MMFSRGQHITLDNHFGKYYISSFDGHFYHTLSEEGVPHRFTECSLQEWNAEVVEDTTKPEFKVGQVWLSKNGKTKRIVTNVTNLLVEYVYPANGTTGSLAFTSKNQIDRCFHELVEDASVSTKEDHINDALAYTIGASRPVKTSVNEFSCSCLNVLNAMKAPEFHDTTCPVYKKPENLWAIKQPVVWDYRTESDLLAGKDDEHSVYLQKAKEYRESVLAEDHKDCKLMDLRKAYGALEDE